jgi:hypothetical protein
MQHELNHIVHTLLGSQNLDEVSKETLASLTREYPYSPILHLLYSKKLQQSLDPHFGESVARTALYFSNPHWLNSLLRPKSSRDVMREMEDAYALSNPVSAAESDHEPVVVEPFAEQTPEPVEEVAPVAALEEPERVEEQAFATDIPEPEPIEDGSVTAFEVPEKVEEQAFATDIPEPEPIEDGSVAEVTGSETVIEQVISGEMPESVQVSAEPVTEISAETEIQRHEPQTTEDAAVRDVQAQSEPEKHWEQPGIRVLDTVTEGLPAEWTVPEDNIVEDISPVRTDEKEAAEESELAVPAIPGLPRGVFKPVNEPVEDGLIPIEPLYTIDYFASQGIQLTDEEKQDPLGKKLKSFTEWLKVMKKVHPEKTKVAMDDKTEVSIKEVAEHSNDRAEVVTEAMAEVYLKQGLKHKALEVYQKLSLLNPALSATFAAKIADLKASES